MIIKNCNSLFILEHSDNISKTHAVFPKVNAGLSWIPLIIHDLFVCTNVHDCKEMIVFVQGGVPSLAR